MWAGQLNGDTNKEQQLAEGAVYEAEGVSLLENGLFEKACNHLMVSFEKIRSVYGDCHPAVANIMDKVGDSLLSLGDDNKALEFYVKSMKIKQNFYRKNHDDIISSFNLIGTLLLNLGRTEEALGYFSRKLLMTIELYGNKHKKTANSLRDMGDAYYYAENYEMAFAKYQESLVLFIDDRWEEQFTNGILQKIYRVLDKIPYGLDIDTVIRYYSDYYHAIPEGEEDEKTEAIGFAICYFSNWRKATSDQKAFEEMINELHKVINTKNTSDEIELDANPLAYYLLVKVYLMNNMPQKAKDALDKFVRNAYDDKGPLTQLLCAFARKEYGVMMDKMTWVDRITFAKENGTFVQQNI
jgi:tetratricopeptide (TPR) repeat protein